MPIAINGSGTVTGVSVGGLPDGIVDTDMLAANAVTAAKTTVPGIQMIDSWHITANYSTNGNNDITSNWARFSAGGFNIGNIGTGMSESSGIFTFPSTGIYQVISELMFRVNGGRSYLGLRQAISSDSGGSFDNALTNYSNAYINTAYANVCQVCTYDITNASTFRIKFVSNFSDTGTVQGGSNYKGSGATFIKMGDT